MDATGRDLRRLGQDAKRPCLLHEKAASAAALSLLRRHRILGRERAMRRTHRRNRERRT
jgi:hypothetical protein